MDEDKVVLKIQKRHMRTALEGIWWIGMFVVLWAIAAQQGYNKGELASFAYLFFGITYWAYKVLKEYDK